MHKSDKMIMDAIDVDFWWREPESMRVVNGESGQMWEGVDYFRVSLPVPWNGGFAQVKNFFYSPSKLLMLVCVCMIRGGKISKPKTFFIYFANCRGVINMMRKRCILF